MSRGGVARATGQGVREMGHRAELKDPVVGAGHLCGSRERGRPQSNITCTPFPGSAGSSKLQGHKFHQRRTLSRCYQGPVKF